MFGKMFSSAGNNTFGSRVREVLAAVAMMWFCMLAAVALFKAIGFAKVGQLGSMPLLGVTTSYLFHSHYFTLEHASVSPFVVMGVLIIVLGAPIMEEIVFRGFFCGYVASDDDGKIKPRGVWMVLAGSFIFFGLAHGNGYFSLMVQGVGGLLLARLWFRNGPNMWAAYLSCVAAHSLYNTSVLATWWLRNS